MRVKQVSVFLENRTGRLDKVADILGSRRINIRALSLADTSDFGILRLIVNQPEAAYEALREAGFTTRYTDVIAVEVPDTPGGLAGVLKIFREANLNVEYLYAFVEKSGQNAVIIFRFDAPEKAIEVLLKHKFTIVPGAKLYEF